MAFSNFPYTDFHNLNLDWILETTKNLVKTWTDYNTQWESWKDDIQNKFDDLVKYVYDNLHELLSETVAQELQKMYESGQLADIIKPLVDEYARELWDNRVSNEWLLKNNIKFNDFCGVRMTLYSNNETEKVVRDNAKIKQLGFSRLRADAWWDELANYSGSSGYPILGFDKTVSAITNLYNLNFKLDINITSNQNMTSNATKFPTTQDEINSFIDTVTKFVQALYNNNVRDCVRFELWNEPETFGVSTITYCTVAKRFYDSIKAIYNYPVIVGNNSFMPDVLIKDYLQNGLFNYANVYNCHPYTGKTYTESPKRIINRYIEMFSNISYKKDISVMAGEYGFLRSAYKKGYATIQTLDLLNYGFSSANYFALYGNYGVLNDDGSDTQISSDFLALYTQLKDFTFVQCYKNSDNYKILQFIDANENMKYIGYSYTTDIVVVDNKSYTLTTTPTVIDIQDDLNCYKNSYADAYTTLFKMTNVLMSKGQINGKLKTTFNLNGIKDTGLYIYFNGGSDAPVTWLSNDYGMLISVATADYILHIAWSGLSYNLYVNFSPDSGATWRGWRSITNNTYGHNVNVDLNNFTTNGDYSYSGGYTNGPIDSVNDFGQMTISTTQSDVAYVIQTLESIYTGNTYKRAKAQSGWYEWVTLTADHGKDLIHPNLDTTIENGTYSFHGGFYYTGYNNTEFYGILQVYNPTFSKYLIQQYFESVSSQSWWRLGVKGDTITWQKWNNE